MNRTAFVVVALAFAFALPSAAQQVPSAHGLQLLPWAAKIEEGRYKSPRDFDKTLKFFRDRWKRSSTVRIHPAVNMPSAKYIHFESLSQKTRWAGLNLYEIPGKGVRLYVIPREVPKKKKATEAGPADTKPTGKKATSG